MDAQTGKIDNSVRDLVNAGLGFRETVSTKLGEVRNDLKHSFEDLVARGAAENGDIAIKLRNGLHDAFAFLGKFRKADQQN